jgi:hypothetical protein
MEKRVKIMLILVIAIIVFSLLLDLTDTRTGYAIKISNYISCSDGDNGDYFKYGKTVYRYNTLSGEYQYLKADTCLGKGQLLEWSCDGVKPVREIISCDCDHGECVVKEN